MSANIIETHALTKRFGKKTVLDGVELAVAQGSVTALLGRNGEGKSTLLRVLVGFHTPTSGSALVLGLDPVRKGPDVRRQVGYVPDRLELPKWMTVADHFRFLEPFYPTWSRTEADRLCKALDLDPASKIDTLSKGFRAKHALVAALAFEPRVLLLDEPFSGLDPIVRGEVLDTVIGHLRDDGRTVMVVRHSLQDVERIADTVVFLEHGRVRRSRDLEEAQRAFARLAVTLIDADTPWTPPGEPREERDGADVLLTYTDWDEGFDALITADPAVVNVRRLARDLDDVFVAELGDKEEPCAV
jgi:ABC-2 type transport system ATP-binding protein